MKWVVCLALFAATACSSVGTAPERKDSAPPAPGWNGSMQELRATLTELEPYLYDTHRYEEPSNQGAIRERIDKLAKIAATVNHDPTMGKRDPTVKFVASQFARNLRRAANQYGEGRRMYARFEIINVTRYCVECHTRMPGGPQLASGKTRPFFAEMPVIDRAEYLISARDFDGAFALLLEALARPAPTGFSTDRASKLALQIAVQFRQSPPQAEQVIRTIEGNPALPQFLKERALGWKRAVKEWQNEKPVPETTWGLRKLVENRATDIEAMRALPRVLALLSAKAGTTEEADLLRLAGQCYEAIDEISSLGLGQNYFEACVRARPHSPTARSCYASLESSILMGYTGTSGTHLPEDVRQELDVLRELSK